MLFHSPRPHSIKKQILLLSLIIFYANIVMYIHSIRLCTTITRQPWVWSPATMYKQRENLLVRTDAFINRVPNLGDLRAFLL